MNRLSLAILSSVMTVAVAACAGSGSPVPRGDPIRSETPRSAAVASPTGFLHVTNIPDITPQGEPPPHDCDQVTESGKVICRIVIHVFASKAHAGTVCDTYNDYRVERANAGIAKVRWVLDIAMKGDPFTYEFDASLGVLITDQQQNYRNNTREASDRFSWEPVPSALPHGDPKRRSPYELHIKRSDGKDCYINDPIIVNEG